MVRISSAVLMRTHRFLLEIHAAGDVNTLRRVVPDGVARLIACDRASFNEMEIGNERKCIVPTPVPASWSRFGAIYAQHMLDHPLWSRTNALQLHQTIALSDRRYAGTWRQTALCNEYFLPLGMKHQLSVLAYRRGVDTIGIAVNRSSRDFSHGDRALLDLISPHIERAWSNTSELARVRRQQATLGSPANQHTIVVDCGSGIIAAVSSGARGLLHKYFDADAGESSALPEEMAGWLAAQRKFLGSLDVLDGAPQCLQVRKDTSTVSARLAQSTTNVAVILLEETDSTKGSSALVLNGLTRRENEILHWVVEGKRNNEIATILTLSPRTVGKHVEHVFEKLGVETRTAAARAALDLGRIEAMNRE